MTVVARWSRLGVVRLVDIRDRDVEDSRKSVFGEEIERDLLPWESCSDH